MGNYNIYRNRKDNKISKIGKCPDKYSTEELNKLAEKFNSEENDRTVVISQDITIGEIIDYLEETEQLQHDWKSAIKKEFLENIENAQRELRDLESYVESFDNEPEKESS